ncbi:MAG: hypothetical protein ACR2H5_26720 [Ktedonobacteraceae bacterium]
MQPVATAFVGLKIANTVSQFSQMWTNLSGGEGMVANLASSFKDKLGGAVDGFLTKQAPAFKQSLDEMKQKSDSAGTSMAEVGTKAETTGTEVAASTTTMDGEMKQLSLWGDEAGTSMEKIGTDAQTSATKVQGAAATEETSLGGVETQANATGTSIDAIGTDATVASTEVEAAAVQEEASLGAVGLEAKATGAAELTIGTDAVEAEGVAKGAFAGITSSMGFLGGMLSLLNINTSQFTGQNRNPTTGPYSGYHMLQNARGGKNIPAGLSLVGGEGPEVIEVPGGSNIYPHGVMPPHAGGGSSLPYSSGGGYSGGGGGSQSGPVNIYVMLDSQQIGHSTAPHIVQEMRILTGMRM